MSGDDRLAPAPSPLRHRWWMLATLLAMTGLAVLGLIGGPLASFSVTQESEEAEFEERGLVEELLEEFGYETSDVLLLLEGEDLFRPRAVAATRELVAALEATPGVLDVLSLDDLPRAVSLSGIESVLPPAGSAPEAWREARQIALSHPLVHGYLSDEAGRTWLLPLSLDHAWIQEHGKQAWLDMQAHLRRLVQEQVLPSGMRASLSGASILMADAETRFEYEQWLYHSIAYILTFALAAVLFRGVWAVILSAGGPLLGVVWTFGLAKLFGLYLSNLTLILLPVMLMMIGFTDSVHLMLHIRKERAHGLAPPQATAAALRMLALPCVLTSITTGLGFASLLTAHSDLVRDFGAACALGVLCTLLAVLTFLPFFASTRLGRHLKQRESSALARGFLPLNERLQDFAARHALKITTLGCCATVAALLYGSSIETESRVRADFPTSSAAVRALGVIDEALGGSNPAQIFVRWDASRDGDWEAILAAIREANLVVQAASEHSRPFSLIDVLGFLAPKGNAAAGLALLELLPQDFSARVLDREERIGTISFLLPDRGYKHFEASFDAWHAQLAELGRRQRGFEFKLGGAAVRSGETYKQFTRDLMESLALAAVIMFVVMTVTFRSLRLGLISVVPNALPLAATAALLVALDIPMAGATAFVMSLGIAVDDTIHFLTRFRSEHQREPDVERAIRRSVLGVGKALVMTTAVLVVGFAAVLTSDFPRNRVFAGMICITLLAALVSDLVLLPAMLRCFATRRTSSD